jgi:hypothetical protein
MRTASIHHNELSSSGGDDSEALIVDSSVEQICRLLSSACRSIFSLQIVRYQTLSPHAKRTYRWQAHLMLQIKHQTLLHYSKAKAD